MSEVADCRPDDDAGAFDFRPYRRDDEEGIVDLLEYRCERAEAIEHWTWKLADKPTSATCVWVASRDGTIAFHYGGIPLRYLINGKIETVIVSVDAKTAREYRRQGVLTRGASLAFANWRANGVAFTLGMPNENWGSRTDALGWIRLFPLQWLVRPVRPERVAARQLRMPWLRRATFVSTIWRRLPSTRIASDSSLSFSRIETADSDFDTIWQKRSPALQRSTVRDRAWVQWRFLQAPARNYEVVLAKRAGAPVGYFAIRTNRSASFQSAYIAELIATPEAPDLACGLLADAVNRCESAGADLIATLAVPGTATHELLRRNGFFRGPAFSVCMVPFAESDNIEELRDVGRWDLTGADFDVV